MGSLLTPHAHKKCTFKCKKVTPTESVLLSSNSPRPMPTENKASMDPWTLGGGGPPHTPCPQKVHFKCKKVTPTESVLLSSKSPRPSSTENKASMDPWTLGGMGPPHAPHPTPTKSALLSVKRSHPQKVYF